MTLTTVDAGMLNSQSQQTWRNRIINGAMVIDQRNAGASVTPTGDQYTIDRWQVAIGSTSGWFSIQQNSANAPVVQGFSQCLKLTSTGANTPSGAAIYVLQYRLEGNTVGDFSFGTSAAKTVTISFWANQSVTGSFGAVLANGAMTRAYGFTYTINVANTWEYKTITIAGDTTGTWPTDTSLGMRLIFNLGTGSGNCIAAGSWQTVSGNAYGATGASTLSSTNGATLYITGVQLEKGSTATSFDYRPYGTELALCQRYYQTYVAINNYPAFHYGVSVYTGVPLSVIMRASPTVTTTGQSTTYFEAGNTYTLTGGTFDSGPTYVSLQYTSSGGTSGYAGTFKPVYQLSAEL